MTSTLLSVEQVGRLVQLSPDAVRRAIRRGELRACKLGGRHRIPPEAVDQWVQDMTVQPPAQTAAPIGTRAVAANLDAYRLTL